MHGRGRSITNPKDIRRMLTEEAPRLADLLRRCGKRVRHAFNKAKDNALPSDPAVLEWAKFYQRGLVEVARAIAEVNDVREKQPALSDAEYRDELTEIAREHLRSMTATEIQALLDEAKAPAIVPSLNPEREHPFD